ncbi:hypothetical protein ASE16_10815 [Leifsonia sp. Root227]|uniref:DUF11 domain-containing protein n=1 Tax=Leifsonia sp. Root227 TaxID=1736496 RepID=UPI0006FC86C8|nr:DUF11 domain-containing protein [Leifsonia sp. Root227]KRC49252.1 hypothetical protein ASE16_10815 [Leifsonia sp. Root227]
MRRNTRPPADDGISRSPFSLTRTWVGRLAAPALAIALAVAGAAAPANAAELAPAVPSATSAPAPAADAAPAAAAPDPSPAPDASTPPADPPAADAAQSPSPDQAPAPQAASDPAPSTAPSPSTAPAPSTAPTPSTAPAPSAPNPASAPRAAVPSPSPSSPPPGGSTGKLIVVKHIADANGTIVDTTPAGWSFTALSAGLQFASQTLTTDGTGSVTYSLSIPAGATSMAVTVTEAQQSGYTLSPQSGLNAVCTYADGTVANVTDGFRVSVPSNQTTRCVVVNREQSATWSVWKTSDPASGTVVHPGDVIDYALHVQFTGGRLPSSLVITDDLSGVLGNATLRGSIVPSQGTAAIVGTNLVWTITNFDDELVLTYSVTVNADARDAHIVNVLLVPPGGECAESCTTDHPVPGWSLVKSSDPASGSTVQPGQTITYTLTAANHSDAPVGSPMLVQADDDLSAVLDHATLVQPIDPALTQQGDHLVWAIGGLAVGQTKTVSYSVKVDPTAAGVLLHNVVTTPPGGSCVPQGYPNPSPELPAECQTHHQVPSVDLSIVKTHSTPTGGQGAPVDSNEGETIAYQLVVANHGQDAATGVSVSDPLPAGISYVPGSLVAPPGWTASIAGGVVTIVYSGTFAVGASATLTFTAAVGVLSGPPSGGPIPDIDNRACVSSAEPDANPSDNCSTDTTPVKSIAVAAQSLCVNDAPVVSYSITPYNLTSSPTIALIWWSPAKFAGHDPSIPAGDEAAILADGAAQVSYVTVPATWTSGQAISGTQLWPGAGVDASGKGNAWPGWRQLGDGTWVLDPAAPFYDVRTDAVVEVRINPTTASAVTYPPPSTHCTPVNATATTTVAGGPSVGLAATGSDVTALVVGGAALVAIGLAFLLWMRRRRGEAA